MKFEKVKSEKGLKFVKVKPEKDETEKPESMKPEISETDKKEKMIYEILKTFCEKEKDRDAEYIKRMEGRYEKYIRKYFPEVLERKEINNSYSKKETVIFMNDKEIYAIKNITVYYGGIFGEKVVKIKNYYFNINEPEIVNEKIKYKEKEMNRKDLYMARIKTGAIMCDIAQMA